MKPLRPPLNRGLRFFFLLFFAFQDPSKGKESFARAKTASGLTAGLTGALGKRTKHQQTQVAQLVLVAESALPATENDAVETAPIIAPPQAQVASQETGEGSEMVSSHDTVGHRATGEDQEAVGDGPVAGGEAVVSPEGGGDEARAVPELGRSTSVGEGEGRAAARRVGHAQDSELLEDISFVERDLENPGKLQVRVLDRGGGEGGKGSAGVLQG